ncbi:hypothetical protein ACGFNU_49380 [Spirillospora sp. NPDC048911]|uniref:hypothetical protein n=1 Tax=Spirillospora sp. NPDC048911 TaxID=3364527 RepID=UPI00371628A7
MSRTKKLAAVSAATVAAACAVAVSTAPAHAEAVVPISATLSGNMTINAGLNFTCTSSTLTGTLDDVSGALSITTASVGGCGVTVTASNFPWTGSLAGGNVTISGFRISAAGCVYGGSLSGTYPVGPLPVTVSFKDAPVSKISGSFLCPSTAKLTANYVFS